MEAKPRTESQDQRRTPSGPRALAEIAARVTKKPLGKRGFAEATLIAEWPAVVGSMLASAALPTKIVFPRGQRQEGCLHLKVASGAIALQIQHQQRLVIDRINAHFGYRAVSRLALSQGPVPVRKVTTPPVARELSPGQEARLEAAIRPIEDPGLRAALAGLGRLLAARE